MNVCDKQSIGLYFGSPTSLDPLRHGGFITPCIRLDDNSYSRVVTHLLSESDSQAFTPKDDQGLHSGLSIGKESDLDSTLSLLLPRCRTLNPYRGRSSGAIIMLAHP